MKLDAAILRELAVAIDVTGYLRIMEARFRASPLGTGHGKTRFSSPTNSFTVLYAAQDLPTALAEKVIRDRFQGKSDRTLLIDDLEALVIVSLAATAPLKLLDLRTSGANRLGVATDAVKARAQAAGRKFSQRLHDTTDFDGIVYMSRITNAECVAIYNRAIPGALDPVSPVVDLVSLSNLVPALTSLNVDVIK